MIHLLIIIFCGLGLMLHAKKTENRVFEIGDFFLFVSLLFTSLLTLFDLCVGVLSWTV